MERGGGDGGWWPEGEPGGERPEEGRPEHPPADQRPEDRDAGTTPPTRPPRPPRPPTGLESRDRPKVASRYSLFVGFAFIALVVVAVLNATSSDEGGLLGADPDGRRGVPIPEFAVPNVLSDLPGDANVAQDDCESSRNPCPADQVRDPACDVTEPGAIRICDYFDKPLLLSFWFTRGGDCTPTQDAFDEVAQRRGDEAGFLSINVLDDRDEIADLVRDSGWEVPVGHDADGAVSNLFGVGVCPTIVLAYPGGIIYEAEIEPGNFDEDEIDAMVDRLVRASARREPTAVAEADEPGSR